MLLENVKISPITLFLAYETLYFLQYAKIIQLHTKRLFLANDIILSAINSKSKQIP